MAGGFSVPQTAGIYRRRLISHTVFDRLTCRHSRRIAAGPGPLQIIAAAAPVHMEHLSGQIQSRAAQGLQPTVHLLHADAAPTHLSAVKGMAAGDRKRNKYKARKKGWDG